jgi:hypothetical protein
MKDPNDKIPAMPKLKGCGHIEVTKNEDGSTSYARCDILSSKKVKLASGQLVNMCESHKRMYEITNL